MKKLHRFSRHLISFGIRSHNFQPRNLTLFLLLTLLLFPEGILKNVLYQSLQNLSFLQSWTKCLDKFGKSSWKEFSWEYFPTIFLQVSCKTVKICFLSGRLVTRIQFQAFQRFFKLSFPRRHLPARCWQWGRWGGVWRVFGVGGGDARAAPLASFWYLYF